MAPRLHVSGDWPAPMLFRSGWAGARARPWNEDLDAVAVRLIRGGKAFLSEVAGELVELTGLPLYSPALYPQSARVWRLAGFEPYVDLDVFERDLAVEANPVEHEVTITAHPDLVALSRLDDEAFEGFWKLGPLGLRDAMDATPNSVAIEIRSADSVTGYALVGSHLRTAFLQRIAVLPEEESRGLGRSLVGASIRWASSVGAGSMLLNVRKENERARHLYRRMGFHPTGSKLDVLRFEI